MARKLGITVAAGIAAGSGSDEDLAVEWDKDGTPIRWEKRQPRDDFGPVYRKRDAVEMTTLRTSAGPAASLEGEARREREREREKEQAERPKSVVVKASPAAQQPQLQSQTHAQPQPKSQPPPKKKRERDPDEIKSGCGCVIM